MAAAGQGQRPQIQPCRYKTGKTLGAGSYSVVKECVHIDTGRYYAAKVINKRMMAGREHMVGQLAHWILIFRLTAIIGMSANQEDIGTERDCRFEESLNGPSEYPDAGGLL